MGNYFFNGPSAEAGGPGDQGGEGEEENSKTWEDQKWFWGSLKAIHKSLHGKT